MAYIPLNPKNSSGAGYVPLKTKDPQTTTPNSFTATSFPKITSSTPAVSSPVLPVLKSAVKQVLDPTKTVEMRPLLATKPVEVKGPRIITAPASVANAFTRTVIEAIPRAFVVGAGEVIQAGKELESAKKKAALPTKTVDFGINLKRLGFEDEKYVNAGHAIIDKVNKGEGLLPATLYEVGTRVLDVAFGAQVLRDVSRHLQTVLAQADDTTKMIEAWQNLGRPKSVKELNNNYRKLAFSLNPDRPDMPASNADILKAVNSFKDILDKQGLPTAKELASYRAGKYLDLLGRPGTPINPLSTYLKRFLEPNLAVSEGVKLPPIVSGQLPGYKPLRPAQSPLGLSAQPVEPVGFGDDLSKKVAKIKATIKDADAIASFKIDPSTKDLVFSKGDVLRPEFATGRIDDVAQKLDSLQKGLGEIFRKSINPKNTTFKELIAKGNQLVDDFVNGVPSSVSSIAPVVAKNLKVGFSSLEKAKQISEPNLEPLIQEARKYKSAEEFVNSMGRGKGGLGSGVDYSPIKRTVIEDGQVSLAEILGKDEQINIYRGVDRADQSKIVDGDYVATSKDLAGSYTGTGKIISQKANLKDIYVDAGDLTKVELEKYLKDPTNFHIEANYITKPVTKSQLTDIWNKAVSSQAKIPIVKYSELEDIATQISKKDLTNDQYQKLKLDIEHAKLAVENNPAAQLVKYVSRETGELPELTGRATRINPRGGANKRTISNTIWGRRGDSIAQGMGYKDVEEANREVINYIKSRNKLREIARQMREVRVARSAVKKGEKLIRLAKWDRRAEVKAIQEAYNLTDADWHKIRQGRDILAMENNEFKDFIKRAEKMAQTTAELKKARVELQATIQEKELKKWENVQKAMSFPSISQMTAKQMDQLNEVLSKYKVGDEFLPVRQLETINRTELAGIRTVREVKEFLGKKYGLTVDQLPEIKPHPWMYDTQLARQHPLYDLLVNRYNESFLKSSGRVIELTRKNDELMKLARKGQGAFAKLVPTDKKIVDWLEADALGREKLAKNMSVDELKAAQYQDKVYREYYDWLAQRNLKQKFASRFEDKYFPNTRRGFLEAWKEDGFLKGLKETFDQFKQEERTLTILNEKTGEILPYEKWVGFTQFRTGNLVPSKNAAKAFQTYVNALEKARQFDEFIPEIMIYVHSLTPKEMTARGIKLNDSVNTFVKKWINSKKGRPEKQIVTPGSKLDWGLRMGVALTRIRDLGLNVPVGIANIFGEQAGNITMLGAQKYALGIQRLATKQGREITNKYANFVGKTFWEKLTEASNTIGDQLLQGIFGLFGAASRTGDRVFLLGSMTPEEFAKGEVSLARLAELRKQMGKYRVVEGSESIFGKTVEGAVAGQYKKWAIPIIVSAKDNAVTLLKIMKEKGAKEALRSKEGSELFYSVILATVLGLGMKGYYDELAESKDRNFLEEIVYKSSRDALSMIGALDPKFIGSFAAPRLSGFIIDLTTALDNILLLEKYKNGKLKGPGELRRTLTPTLINPLIKKQEESKGGGTKLPKGLPSLPELPKPASLPKLPALPSI